MSKKTEEIFKSIENLQELQNQIAEYNKTVMVRDLQDVEFHMSQELKKLKFLIESLYSYNGRSTSYAKRQASKENGKKGGRPPKEISTIKKRLAELEVLLPELKHQLDLTDDVAERKKIEINIEEFEKEKSTISAKIMDFISRSK